jgi:creatinine amidohydrolase/Fe(II)-dependent formamide hydrolase-like protein
MTRTLTALGMACAIGTLPFQAQSGGSRVQRLEDLRWPQIDALDRERTMFILPVGMLEQHGPHLPVGADTFGVLFEANGAAARVSEAIPNWRVVMMPPINYGESGANEIANDLIHPGTYGIRQSTLRSLVADVGAQVAQNGFKWIFVTNGHGAPTHNIAINEACDFVSESFGVTMLHLTALFRADSRIQAEGRKLEARFFTPAEIASFGLDVHAGVGETSALLAVRPDLVDPGFRKLPSRSARTREDLAALAAAPGWQGYFSSPAMANAAFGKSVESWWADGFADLILRAVKGENLLNAPRMPDRIDPAVASILGKALENERAFELKLADWLSRRRKQ